MSVLGGGAFGRWLGHDNGGLMNRIYALIKDTSCVFCHMRTWWEMARKQAFTRHQSVGILILDFPAVRNKCFLFKPPSLWYFCYNSLNGLGQYSLCFSSLHFLIIFFFLSYILDIYIFFFALSSNLLGLAPAYSNLFFKFFIWII